MFNHHRVWSTPRRLPIIDRRNHEFSWDLSTWLPVPMSDIIEYTYDHWRGGVIIKTSDGSVWFWSPRAGTVAPILNGTNEWLLTPTRNGMVGVRNDMPRRQFAKWGGWPPRSLSTALVPADGWEWGGAHPLLHRHFRHPTSVAPGVLMLNASPRVRFGVSMAAPVHISENGGDDWSIVNVGYWRAYGGASDWGNRIQHYDTGLNQQESSLRIYGVWPLAPTAGGVVALVRGLWNSIDKDTRHSHFYHKTSSTYFVDIAKIKYNGDVDFINHVFIGRYEHSYYGPDDNSEYSSAQESGVPLFDGPVYLGNGEFLLWTSSFWDINRFGDLELFTFSPVTGNMTQIPTPPLGSHHLHAVAALPDNRIAWAGTDVSASFLYWVPSAAYRIWHVYQKSTGEWQSIDFGVERSLLDANNYGPRHQPPIVFPVTAT